mgnify:CR=1 FL=1
MCKEVYEQTYILQVCFLSDLLCFFVAGEWKSG